MGRLAQMAHATAIAHAIGNREPKTIKLTAGRVIGIGVTLAIALFLTYISYLRLR